MVRECIFRRGVIVEKMEGQREGYFRSGRDCGEGTSTHDEYTK
jgi:hypothetical protein